MQLTNQRCTVELVGERIRTDYVVHIYKYNISARQQDVQIQRHILRATGAAERQKGPYSSLLQMHIYDASLIGNTSNAPTDKPQFWLEPDILLAQLYRCPRLKHPIYLQTVSECRCTGLAMVRVPQRLPLNLQRISMTMAGIPVLRQGLKRYNMTLQEV